MQLRLGITIKIKKSISNSFLQNQKVPLEKLRRYDWQRLQIFPTYEDPKGHILLNMWFLIKFYWKCDFTNYYFLK